MFSVLGKYNTVTLQKIFCTAALENINILLKSLFSFYIFKKDNEFTLKIQLSFSRKVKYKKDVGFTKAL